MHTELPRVADYCLKPISTRELAEFDRAANRYLESKGQVTGGWMTQKKCNTTKKGKKK